MSKDLVLCDGDPSLTIKFNDRNRLWYPSETLQRYPPDWRNGPPPVEIPRSADRNRRGSGLIVVSEKPQKTAMFVGSALEELADLPPLAQEELGFGLHCVQAGIRPPDSRDFESLKGVFELRTRINEGNQKGAFRLMYTYPKLAFSMHTPDGASQTWPSPVVAILHAFTKKTQKTSPGDIAITKKRLQAVTTEWPKSGWRGGTL